MMNLFAKCLLVSTSLSPVLGAMALYQFERGEPWTSWICWLVVAVLLMIICWLLLRYMAQNGQKQSFEIREFERKDQELLAFLFIYLLPFVRSENATFASQWLTSVYILTIIILAIAHAGAFHFNPVMRLFGYRFYAVKNRHGMSNLLISKKDLRRHGEELRTVQLARDVFLHADTEDSDA